MSKLVLVVSSDAALAEILTLALRADLSVRVETVSDCVQADAVIHGVRVAVVILPLTVAPAAQLAYCDQWQADPTIAPISLLGNPMN